MPRYKHYTQLVVFDTLAVICMVLAIALGWLPGPGGVPLFIVGLSLLAINHDWAKRYINLLREYADKISDMIFIPKLRWFFDMLAVVLLSVGGYLLYRHSAIWTISLGIFNLGLGLVCLFGNRNRYARLKKAIKKH